jgi:hypothetical protein
MRLALTTALTLIAALNLNPNLDLNRARADETPVKKWVLYSWQTNKGWNYALLPRPSVEHSKRWAELNLVKVSGWDALKSRLKNIRSGEHLAFGTAEEIDDLPAARLLEVPRTEVRRKIRAFSKEHGFELGSSLPRARSTISD